MIHARIQAHPARRHLHPALVSALAPLPTEVVEHSSDPPSPWAGYQQTLRDGLDAATEDGHLLLIQDDAQVCLHFPEAVEKVASEHVTVLFLSRLPRRISVQALRASKRGDRYVTTQLKSNEFCPVVAVLWPVAKAREFLHWTETNQRRLGHQKPRSDDGVLGRWCAFTRQTVRFTVPSLVQHPDLEPSLIGRKPSWGKDAGRVALQFAEDGLAYEW